MTIQEKEKLMKMIDKRIESIDLVYVTCSDNASLAIANLILAKIQLEQVETKDE